MSNTKLNIGVSIGREDLDIAAWYNMLKENNLPITTWTNNVVLAFLSDRQLDIGTVCLKRQEEKVQTTNFMFGSGNSLQVSTKNQRKEKWSWKTRGINGEFIEGSVLQLHIRNEDVIYALKTLKAKGYTYSGTVKALIRKYLKTGDSCVPPAGRSLSMMVALEYLDKSELHRPQEKKDSEDFPSVRLEKKIRREREGLEQIKESIIVQSVEGKEQCLPDETIQSQMEPVQQRHVRQSQLAQNQKQGCQRQSEEHEGSSPQIKNPLLNFIS